MRIQYALTPRHRLGGIVRQVIDAAELRHHNAGGSGPRRRAHMRRGHYRHAADALTLVLDQDIWNQALDPRPKMRSTLWQ